MKIRLLLSLTLSVLVIGLGSMPADAQKKGRRTRVDATGKPHHTVVGHHYQPIDEPAAGRIKRRHHRKTGTHGAATERTRHHRKSKHYYPRKED